MLADAGPELKPRCEQFKDPDWRLDFLQKITVFYMKKVNEITLDLDQNADRDPDPGTQRNADPDLGTQEMCIQSPS